MKIRKLICLVLAFSMVITLGMLTSCGKSDSEKTDNGNKTEANGTSEAIQSFNALPTADFGGYEFRVLTRDAADQYWLPNDVCAEETTSEPINDAVYQRQQMVQNKYNIKISQLEQSDYQEFARTSILAQDNSFDVILMDTQRAGKLAIEDLLIEYNQVPHVDLSKPYWDTNTIEQLTIANKCYFALGDINITDNNATWCLLFNKSLYNELDLGNAYETVNEGKWTIDKFYDICKGATSDLNGDGTINYESDRFGAVGQYECAVAMMASSGIRCVEKDDKDIPQFNLDSAKASSVFEKVFKYMSDENAMIRADDYDFAERWTVINVGTFKSGRAVYYMCPLTHAVQMRDMVEDFGILPLPKYDEDQEQYYSAFQPINATCYCIPKNCEDVDRAGLILEAMASASTDTLKEAYYDITLQGRTTRDEESKDMIDLILENRIADLGYVYNWNDIRTAVQDIIKGSSNTYASTIDSLKTAYIKAMDDTVKLFES